MKLQKKKHHRKFPERCAPFKTVRSVQKINPSAVQKNKKSPEKSHCASRKWREIASANQRNLKSRRKKQKTKRWQCLKKSKQPNNFFWFIHVARKCKEYSPLTNKTISPPRMTSNAPGCKHCQKEAVKPRGQYHGRFCNQPFFFSWRWEMQNLGLRSTYFHNRRPHWATDFKQLQAKRRAEVLIRTIWRMWVTVRNLGDQGDKSAWSDSYTG